MQKGIPYISPYNHLDIIIGQGTIGCEIYEDLPSVDVVIVSVGGGGLISGIASYLKSVKPGIKIVGCEAVKSCPMQESVKAGKVVTVEVSPTLSDGTAGDVEPGAITLEFCQKLVDDWVLITEDEISSAIYNTLKYHHKIIEGAAGLAVAAYIKTMDKYKGKNVVIISCGRNISMQKLKAIINKHND
ncbi:Threonine dehydratase biosynthetic, chloroplastic [Exaiptasia diaphana]|nr:Threonine dehydratase biosynthetic, chloroplastic [Exaiptasia diaphana]